MYIYIPRCLHSFCRPLLILLHHHQSRRRRHFLYSALVLGLLQSVDRCKVLGIWPDDGVLLKVNGDLTLGSIRDVLLQLQVIKNTLAQ